MAWTKSLVAFGKVADSVLIDAVPLEEISSIHVMQDGNALTNNGTNTSNSVSEASSKVISGENASTTVSKKRSLAKSNAMRGKSATMPGKQASSEMETGDSTKDFAGSIMGPNTISIMTDHNGYNSGRKYYVQALSDADRREIVTHLLAKSKAAKKEKESKGRIQRAKEKVARLTGSKPFQYFFAILIVFVSTQHCPSHFAEKRVGHFCRAWMRGERLSVTVLVQRLSVKHNVRAAAKTLRACSYVNVNALACERASFYTALACLGFFECSCMSRPARAQNFAANVMQMQLEDRLVNADGSISSTGRTLDSLDMFFTLIFTVELGFNMFAHWFRDFFKEGWNWCAAENACAVYMKTAQ